MPYTYSINPSSTTQASTLGLGGTPDLSGLLDNTSNLVSPKDIRDMVFTLWENTPVRYTSVSGVPYIGVARDNVKDMKFFLGKKQLSGTNLMNPTLLSSDADIFIYNTKSDSAPTQNTEVKFLAGNPNTVNHNLAPYVRIAQITGTSSNFLSFTIAHENPAGGDINILSGPNTGLGRVNLNGLRFPSRVELPQQISTPTNTIAGDLFLVRNASGNIELKNAPGLSPFTLPTFTDPNPVPQDIGGIPAGSTFSNVPIIEMIRSILYPFLGPQANILTVPPIKERDHASGDTANYGYSITKRSGDVEDYRVRVTNSTGGIMAPDVTPPSGPPGPVPITGPGFFTNNYTGSKTFTGANIFTNIPDSLGRSVFTFSFSVTDSLSDAGSFLSPTQSDTATAELKYVYPYFYGYAPTASNPETLLSLGTFNKSVTDYGDTDFTIQGGPGYLFFWVPQGYGLLDQILDQNGNVLYPDTPLHSSWTYSSATVNSPDSKWTGAAYTYYRRIQESSTPTTATFSIKF
jgi:hypothetical protein